MNSAVVGVKMPPRQAGVALILVLWMLTLLTLIATGLSFSTRTETVLTGNQYSLARARALADSAVYKGIYELSKPVTDPVTGFKADGQTRVLILDGVRVELTILDEAAFIDLNKAPESLMKGLLVSSGAEEDAADRLLAAIADWRDPDELVRTNGAERSEYEFSGLKAPANADFLSVDELIRVIGMSRELFNRIENAITVYSGQPGIDSRVAPRQVLLALPNATHEEVDNYLEQRLALRAESLPIPPFPPAAAFPPATSSGGGVYNFKALVKLADNTVFVRQAVVKMAREIRQPYIILDWKEGSP
jgi:general secretion pathway protein K